MSKKHKKARRKYFFTKRDMSFIVEGVTLLYDQPLTDWSKIDNCWLKEVALELNGNIQDLKIILEDDFSNWEIEDE